MAGRWLQLDVALVRDQDGAGLTSARHVFDELEPLVDEARRRRRVRTFFFTRKPPDLRLRVEGADPETDVAPGMRAALRSMHRAGFVERWYTGRYEPETRKFGGTGAMAAVHRYFDIDTRVWVGVDRLRRDASTMTGEPAEAVAFAFPLMGAVADDLFVRTLGDRDEVWDTWCNVASLASRGGSGYASVTDPDPAAGPPSPPTLVDVVRSVDPRIGRAISVYAPANQRLADALRRELRDAALGPRAVLAFIGQFTFQRWGLDGLGQARLAVSRAETWHPARGLRGGR